MTDKRKDDVVQLARKRLTAGMTATLPSRTDQLDDLRFLAGSPDNKWQWPTEIVNSRTSESGIAARPCLTVNQLPQHVRQVTNDQRQNRPAGKVIPANDKASVEVAEVYDGLVRHIEYISSADVAYDTASDSQVASGEGFWRIVTEYESEDSFDQDIFLRRIRNPFSVYMDTMAQDPCGEDAGWAIIAEDILKTDYATKYKDATPISSIEQSGTGDQAIGDWMGQDTIRIAECFFTEIEKATLNLYPDNNTAFEGTKEDAVMLKHYPEGPIKSRQSDRKKIRWYKTNGYEILEERDWAGKYIPVIRVVGNEFEIEGQIYYSGIVRNAKDAQRMYNYHSSNEVEMIALAPKSPFVGYEGQFEGYEEEWRTANTVPHPYLQVKVELDGDGRALPLPQRQAPPMLQSGIIAAKQAALEDIKSTTGQYNASLGQTSNERSGKAILARQHEGDVSTYHYVDNLARAVRYSTRQLIDLIPKIYDRPGRVARIIGEDGVSSMVEIDPEQQHPMMEVQDSKGNVIKKIYNPSVGRYDVVAVTGPGYATKRREALESMATLLQGNPELWKVAGDLFVKNMDWPGAQELAKRLAKTIPPELMRDDDDPALQAAQKQIEELMKQVEYANHMLQNQQHSYEAKDLSIKMYDAQTKRFDAETKRIAATAPAMTADQIHDIAAGTADAAIRHHLSGGEPVEQQQEQPPAEQAPPIDPNKAMMEDSKHALQDKQHEHERGMAELAAEQAPAPEEGQ